MQLDALFTLGFPSAPDLKSLRYEAEEKSSLKRAHKSYEIDPKPSDLSMSRLKLE